MKLTPQHYAKTLYETLQDTTAKDHDKILDNFVQALAQNNDLKLFDKIEEEFERIEKTAKGIKLAEVTSAKSLDKKEEHQIIEHLNDLVKGKVELKTRIDENLLGGVVIKLEDTLIDASVKSTLDNLKKDLEQ